MERLTTRDQEEGKHIKEKKRENGERKEKERRRSDVCMCVFMAVYRKVESKRTKNDEEEPLHVDVMGETEREREM